MMEPRLLQDVTSASGSKPLEVHLRHLSHSAVLQPCGGNQGLHGRSGAERHRQAAAVSGLTICGKTGSAESNDDGRPVTHGWFIGFIDDDDYPYAVAVLVEDVNDGDGGGSVAAPIAQDIFTYLKENSPVSPSQVVSE